MTEHCECETRSWCERYGCIKTDEASRLRYTYMAQRAKESNNQIDELEAIFGGLDQ